MQAPTISLQTNSSTQCYFFNHAYLDALLTGVMAFAWDDPEEY